MSWEIVGLGDFLTLKRGYDLPAQQRHDGEIPVVSSSGITGSHNEAKVAPPGVVTGRYGTLGEVFYIEQPFWPLNTSLYVKDFKGNNPRFIAYFLKWVLNGAQSDKAAVPGVNRNDLHARKVIATTDYAEQQKIGDILSAYDDLIGNNRRRIQLLEQSARLLYKEWFVHLRFPGHEHVKIIDGVPEGWERKKLGEITSLNYGKALKESDREPGPFPVYGSSGIIGSHVKALISGPVIIVGRKGNVGSVFWSSEDCHPIDTVFYINRNLSSFFLYHALQNMTFISTDVAVPGLNRGLAQSHLLLLPEQRIFNLFEGIVTLIQMQIDTLSKEIVVLSQARDLLLPRLMNGEVLV
ncbi:MAG: restriction endonuclease subunit S [Thermovirgaceae bacterium]|nr:restriction endonuclease subunit S [Thermovirgaceae bacterium]